MNLIGTFIIWSWLLAISLIIPTTLPAGGAQESIIERRENNINSPLIALKEFNLLSVVNDNSSILTKVKVGTPVKVLKVWDQAETGQWLLANVLIRNCNQLFFKRGWVNIDKF